MHSIKYRNGGVRYQSRSIAQNYEDKKSASISTKATTVQRFTEHVLLSLAESLGHTNVHTRHITQVYMQSNAHTEQKVYICPPPKMNFPSQKVLKDIQPFYGRPKSRLHGYLRYVNQHINNLGMKRSQIDLCLFFQRKAGRFETVMILQIDYSVVSGSSKFSKTEEH